MANPDFTENTTHIHDVVSYLKCCSETFGQLEAILTAIEAQSEEGYLEQYDIDAVKLINSELYCEFRELRIASK